MRCPNDEESDRWEPEVDKVWEEYEPKFRALLGELGDTFRAEGWEVEGIFDLSDEEYALELAVSKHGVRGEAQLTLLESVTHDGTLDGLAFSIDLHAQCGHVIGGMTPYNYTSELWVPMGDSEALGERWSMFEAADPYEAVYVLESHLEGCKDVDFGGEE